MKIGFNMLLWDLRVRRKHVREFRMLKKAGADGVELPIMEGNVAHCRQLGGILDDIGLERTCVMAISDPRQNPISENPRRRKAGADYMRQLIERANALGAAVIGGPMYQTLGEFSGKGPTDREKQWAADMLRAVGDHAKQAGITLAVEPLNRFECYLLNTLEDAAALVKRVGHPSVGVMFDTFHGNIEENDPVGCIRRHGGLLRHFHVSANHRGIPGRDHIDWRGTFKALRAVGYDGWLVAEVFGRELPGLAAATRIWRDRFSSNEEAARETVAFMRKNA